jgi:hypothetical protein
MNWMISFENAVIVAQAVLVVITLWFDRRGRRRLASLRRIVQAKDGMAGIMMPMMGARDMH